MSRPTHIPICRITHLLPSPGSTPWRRAQRGDYGPLTLDAKGRQQVEIEIVEAVHRTTFSDADLTRAFNTSSSHKQSIARTHERLRRLDPGPIHIDTGPVNFFSKREAEQFALGCVQARDRAWALLLARINRI
jgi:hypothetical protein